MLPETVVDRQVPRQPPVPLLRVPESHGVGPLPAERLDESLRFAVGPGGVWPGPDVLQPEGEAGLGERRGDVGGAVVAHHPAALDPLAVEPGDRTAEEADHGGLQLVRQDLDVSQPGGVIDDEMNLVAADAIGTPLLTIASDPVANHLESS